ncbi:hypothetical protein KEJ32_07815 [Candidatus Bathyarchaeota archaeon]|nr:hypothetical protein [Candidatus Bathyarchaeota archaeon]
MLVRPSGTEPLYRLYAEAKTRRKALRLVQDFILKLKRIINSLKV